MYGGASLECPTTINPSSRRYFSQYLDAACGQVRGAARYDSRYRASEIPTDRPATAYTATASFGQSSAQQTAAGHTCGGTGKRIVSYRKLKEMKSRHAHTLE